MRVRIGSRESALAKWQANFIAARLKALGCDVEMVWITTEGDVSAGTATPLTQAGGVGVFTKAIQRALFEDRCDVAVHSLKDLPTATVAGLTVAATTEREDVRDCLLSVKYKSFDDLPAKATIGTGSPRRVAQILRLRSDVQCKPIRGNVDTRIQKMQSGEYDAIMLAAAGLSRLQLDAKITEHMDTDRMLPAVGQAALGIECRSDDSATLQLLSQINHLPSWIAVTAERSLLRTLRAGCLAPMGVQATLDGNVLSLRGRLLSANGQNNLQTNVATRLSAHDTTRQMPSAPLAPSNNNVPISPLAPLRGEGAGVRGSTPDRAFTIDDIATAIKLGEHAASQLLLGGAQAYLD